MSFKKTLLIIFLCGLCFFAYIRFIEPSILKIERVKIGLAAAPQMKIVQLSDIHSKSYGWKEKKVLNMLEKEDFDFIFLTGDMVDWQTKDLESVSLFWRELADLKPGKVFAVFGNHDHSNQKFSRINGLLEESGIEVLVNEGREEIIGENSFYLAGVDDPHSGMDNLITAEAGRKSEEAEILLAHSPEIFRKVDKSKETLVLAGHTHGCQINLPILCDLIVPLEYDKQYQKGLFYEDKASLYVNRGVGETFLPFRFNSPPEIAIIEIN